MVDKISAGVNPEAEETVEIDDYYDCCNDNEEVDDDDDLYHPSQSTNTDSEMSSFGHGLEEVSNNFCHLICWL